MPQTILIIKYFRQIQMALNGIMKSWNHWIYSTISKFLDRNPYILISALFAVYFILSSIFIKAVQHNHRGHRNGNFTPIRSYITRNARGLWERIILNLNCPWRGHSYPRKLLAFNNKHQKPGHSPSLLRPTFELNYTTFNSLHFESISKLLR